MTAIVLLVLEEELKELVLCARLRSKTFISVFHPYQSIYLIVVPDTEASQQIEPAFPAILGHRSEHSLATGPVIPEPFISPLGLTMTPALSKHIKQSPLAFIRAR